MIGYLQRILGYAATGAQHHICRFLTEPEPAEKTVSPIVLAVPGDYAITLALPGPHRRQMQPRHRTRRLAASASPSVQVTENGKFDEER